MHHPLDLDQQSREALWSQVTRAVETYLRDVDKYRVAPLVPEADLRQAVGGFDFRSGKTPKEAVDFIVKGMTDWQLHTAHPDYFGVFNPCPTAMGIAGEVLAAGFNPQLASWPSAPFAIEVEQHVLRSFGELFGYSPETMLGSFTSGGTEANHTALLTAMVRSFAEFPEKGLRAISAQPTLYVSAEGHHSFLKAARLCGLGTECVREIPVDSSLVMDVEALSSKVKEDRARGFIPFFVVATAGTTSGGTVDPIRKIAELAVRENLWMHLDAAWGGPAILLPELKPLFDGVESVDSITLDAHKWLSVPMTAGMFLTRHPDLVEKTFRVDGTAYMPPDSWKSSRPQPYAQSMAWSRRFIGLKVFLSLAVAGWDGYRDTLRHQVRMGESLREKLRAAGWRVLNQTSLPVVCFTEPHGLTSESTESIARRLAENGKTWVTTTRLGNAREPALRAGIASYRTQEEHLDILIEELERSRKSIELSNS